MLPLYHERIGQNAYLDDRSGHVRARCNQSEVTLPNLGQLAESVVPRNKLGPLNSKKQDKTESAYFGHLLIMWNDPAR